MPEKIARLNEEVIKGQIKELVRGSIEENLNELLEDEAQKLTHAVWYKLNEQRQSYRDGHYSRNLTTTSGMLLSRYPGSRGSPLRQLSLSGITAGRAVWKKLSLKFT